MLIDIKNNCNIYTEAAGHLYEGTSWLNWDCFNVPCSSCEKSDKKCLSTSSGLNQRWCFMDFVEVRGPFFAHNKKDSVGVMEQSSAVCFAAGNEQWSQMFRTVHPTHPPPCAEFCVRSEPHRAVSHTYRAVQTQHFHFHAQGASSRLFADSQRVRLGVHTSPDFTDLITNNGHDRKELSMNV